MKLGLDYKFGTLVLGFVIVGLLIGVFITRELSPAITFTISELYPGAPKYTIWVEGDNYFAKSSSGIIDTSTDFSALVQKCINMSDSLSILFEEGVYTATKKIILNKHFEFRGHGGGATMTWIQLCPNFPDDCLFEVKSLPSGGFYQLPIFERMLLNGKKSLQTHQVNCFNQLNGSCIDMNFRDLWFESWPGHAINLTCYGQHRIWNCWFEHFVPQYEAIISDKTTINNSPHYVNVESCYFAETAGYKNYGAVETVCWTWIDNTFAGGDVTGLDMSKTLWWKVVANTFRSLTTGIILDSTTTRSGEIIGNVFATNVSSISGSINMAYPTIIQANRGYETENWNTALASNNDWIAHGLSKTPDVVIVNVAANDALYLCQVIDKNSTHFQITLYDFSNSRFETEDKLINWYAFLRP